MIKERYCSFEVAKLLKEKGFRDNCASAYMTDGDVRDLLENTVEWDNGLINWNSVTHDDLCYWGIAGWNVECSRPTHQMAMDWLNETHNIFLIVEPYSKTSCYFSLWEGDDIYRENPLKKDFPSYGETVEAALKYCLTELI